jgi:L-ascorbate oxidase
MNHRGLVYAFVAFLALQFCSVNAEDPYLFFTWNVTYGTIAPFGVKQQAIMINGQFPGPSINCSSNNNIVINVLNNLDEPFLLSWFVFLISEMHL